MNKIIVAFIVTCASLHAQDASNKNFTALDVLQALHATYDLHPYKTVYREYHTSPTNNRFKQNNPNGTRRFKVVGNSMLPTLPPFTSVTVDENIPFDKIKPGDIIVYYCNNNKSNGTPYVVHRVYSKQNDMLICKGDNNPVVDRECITSDNFVGKVIDANSSLVCN